MVRSLNSGVAALKSHQTKLDVIGNNIANVNTYGFKGSRVTFRDLYYQSTRGAAAPGSGGGINPSQVGYGSTMGSIDILQTQAALTTTGNPLDLAISGEGYFQVMDGDGNRYFTRAGMLDIDSAGNLIDTNGNFILGVNGKAVGKPANNQKITLAIPAVDPAKSKVESDFEGSKITIEAGNSTSEGNVNFSITTSDTLPVGDKAVATVKSGSISVQLNPNAVFTTFTDLTSAIENAISAATGGEAHPAGKFTINVGDKLKDLFNTAAAPGSPALGMTGAQIVATTANPIKPNGTNNFRLTNVATGGATAAVSVKDAGIDFPGLAVGTTLAITGGAAAGAADDGKRTITMGAYTVTCTKEELESGKPIKLVNGTSATDFITINISSDVLGSIAPKTDATGNVVAATTTLTIENAIAATQKGKALGLGQSFKLTGGTEGGPQSVKDLSSIAIGANGVITGIHGILGELELGRIDLATFDNPKGLSEVGDTYYAASENSGKASPNKIGEGGTGSVMQSMLEMSNVDISEQFTDMITTQRGFQANSRIVTVTDTMLEELINLKR